MYGTIREVKERYYRIICGKCLRSEIDTRRYDVDIENIRFSIVPFLRSLGWENTAEHGWICPTCQERVK